MKAVEVLRFNSGEEAIRRGFYSEFGQDLYERFDAIQKGIEAFLAGDPKEVDEDDEFARALRGLWCE